jgi:hypothetical protein
MKRKHVSADAEEDEDSGSLLFDLTTLRRATANFAEENKLGHGGFGAVYKVRRRELCNFISKQHTQSCPT